MFLDGCIYWVNCLIKISKFIYNSQFRIYTILFKKNSIPILFEKRITKIFITDGDSTCQDGQPTFICVGDIVDSLRDLVGLDHCF
jgi:hypothetical protein